MFAIGLTLIQSKLWLILCQNSQFFVTMATRVGLFEIATRLLNYATLIPPQLFDARF